MHRRHVPSDSPGCLLFLPPPPFSLLLPVSLQLSHFLLFDSIQVIQHSLLSHLLLPQLLNSSCPICHKRNKDTSISQQNNAEQMS